MIESRLGNWRRKDSNNSITIIMNLKHKRKKRLKNAKHAISTRTLGGALMNALVRFLYL